MGTYADFQANFAYDWENAARLRMIKDDSKYSGTYKYVPYIDGAKF